MCRHILNSDSVGALTTSLGSLFQWLTNLPVKNIFLTHNLNVRSKTSFLMQQRQPEKSSLTCLHSVLEFTTLCPLLLCQTKCGCTATWITKPMNVKISLLNSFGFDKYTMWLTLWQCISFWSLWGKPYNEYF